MKKLIFLLLALPCLFFSAKAQHNSEILTQTIRGSVLDKVVQSSLPGAVVQVTDVDPVIAVMADSNGNYALRKVPVGRHTIKISFMGYKEIQIPNVTVNSGKETILNISMEEEILTSDEVVVVAKKNSSQANNNLIQSSVTNLRTEDINRFAGSRQDPSRMAANYAGVASAGDSRNDIIVRGNSPTGVLWRLEGVDIPNPNHFTFTGNTGGVFSVLNNNLLANSDFLTGAFPAEYGNKTAAVFDVKLRNGNNQKRENTFQAGLNGIEFGTEGPISKKKGSSYLVSYRFLSFEVMNKLGVNFGVSGIPSFHDLTFKINLPTEKAGTFTIWGIGGTSKIFIHEKNPDENSRENLAYNDVDFRSSMFATGVSHSYQFSKNTTGKLILSSSASAGGLSSTNIYKDDSEIKEYDHKNTDGQHIVNYTLMHRVNTRNNLKVGVIYRDIYYKTKDTFYDFTDSAFVEGLDTKSHAGLVQTFAHWQYRASDRLITNLGVYYQRFLLNNTQALEPRASMSYELNNRQRITFASGLHSQTQSLFMYDYKFYDSTTARYKQSNKNIDMTRALHVVAGYQRSILENLRLKAEVYYQYMYNVPVSQSNKGSSPIFSPLNAGGDFSFSVADSLKNTGTGRNYGVELTLEKGFAHNFYFLTTLSLFDSKYKTPDGVLRNTTFNYGHVFNLLAGKEFHLDAKSRRVISVDMKLTHTGGRRIWDVNKEESIKQNRAVFDFAHVYETQLPSYFRTDLKVSYNINKAKSTHNIFLAADNLLNTQNILDRNWDNDKQEVATYYQMGLYPYLGYRVQF
jgi:hypothetical protein